MSAPITPSTFDRMSTTSGKARIVWTAEAIGAKIGCSADFVRNTLVNIEGSPVRKIGSRYAAHEGDLIEFFRSRPGEL